MTANHFRSWAEYALCRQTDPEAFFPEDVRHSDIAKAICQRCEVREQCLAYALENDERYGVWGGLSESDRYELKARTRWAS